MQKLYATTVHSAGDGRNGHVESDDGILRTEIRVPKELGGPGGETNPEQLFAAGYAACFHSALKLVAAGEGVDPAGTEVSATVALGRSEDGGFGLAVELDVSIPSAERAVAESLVAKAHQVCPYSNATRGNIEVTLSVV